MSNVQILNYTPHNVVLIGEDDQELHVFLPHCKTPIRCLEHSTKAPALFSDVQVPVHIVKYGGATGLPDEQEGVALIVSKMVADCCPDRSDLFYPFDVVRDEFGQPIGCRSLGKLSK